MKTVVVVLAALLSTAALAFDTHRGNIITITDEEAAKCDEGGGCVLVTKAAILEAVEALARKYAGSCGNRT